MRGKGVTNKSSLKLEQEKEVSPAEQLFYEPSAPMETYVWHYSCCYHLVAHSAKQTVVGQVTSVK